MVERDFHTVDRCTISSSVVESQDMLMESLCICNVFFAEKDHVLVTFD